MSWSDNILGQRLAALFVSRPRQFQGIHDERNCQPITPTKLREWYDEYSFKCCPGLGTFEHAMGNVYNALGVRTRRADRRLADGPVPLFIDHGSVNDACRKGFDDFCP